MTGSTSISGEASGHFCVVGRAWIAKYMYKGVEGFSATLFGPKSVAEVEAYWDKPIAPLTDNNGLLGQLFEAKDKNAGACDPVIGYRGTVFNDQQGILIIITIHAFGINNYVVVSSDKKTRVKWQLSRPETKEFTLVYSKSEEITIVVDSIIQNEKYNLDGSAKLEIYATDKGDWGTNMLQAMGKNSAKYSDAIKYGSRAIDYLGPKICAAKESAFRTPKGQFVGHSLGGGLASAAAIANQNQADKIGLPTEIQVYNAAGVHANTVGQTGSGYQAVAKCPAIDTTVRDEILTTLQSDPHRFPFVRTLFRVFALELPSAVAAPSRRAAKTLSGAAANEILPLPQSEFPKISALDQALRPAASANALAQALNDYLIANYGTQLTKEQYDQQHWVASVSKYPDTLDMYKTAVNRMVADLQPEFEKAEPRLVKSIDRHGMDRVIVSCSQ